MGPLTDSEVRHPPNLATRLALSLILTLAATVCAGGFALAQCTDSDADEPAPTQAAFYLAAGIIDSVEGSLGTDGSGLERSNDDPCP